MVTLFSTAKPFVGPWAVLQRNAIRSWAHLDPRPEIILFGCEAGVSEICEEIGARHVPDVARSPEGTPLVSTMFEAARQMASADVLCFVNADIVLLDDFVPAVDAVRRWSDRFLMIARRHDVAFCGDLDFGEDWQGSVRTLVDRSGRIMGPVWIDLFVFSRDLFPEIPPFAVGRSAYDNWLIWQARHSGAPVVDATDALLLVHQEHDYSHGGGKTAVWEGPEATRAHQLIGDWRRYYSVFDATHQLDADLDVHPAVAFRYRAARPRAALSHALRFTRPIRRRIRGEYVARRRRS